jgi:hypothetical protein
MGSFKISGKYVLYRAIESIYYDEQNERVVVRTVSGDILNSMNLEQDKALDVINTMLRQIHDYFAD